jgi:hypothetical protein
MLCIGRLYGKIYPEDEICLGEGTGPAVVLEVKEEYDATDFVTKLAVKVRYPDGKKNRFTTKNTKCWGIFWDYGDVRDAVRRHYSVK